MCHWLAFSTQHVSKNNIRVRIDLTLQQQNIVSFRIVQHGLCLFTLDKSFLSHGDDRRFEIGDFKEQHGLVL